MPLTVYCCGTFQIASVKSAGNCLFSNYFQRKLDYSVVLRLIRKSHPLPKETISKEYPGFWEFWISFFVFPRLLGLACSRCTAFHWCSVCGGVSVAPAVDGNAALQQRMSDDEAGFQQARCKMKLVALQVSSPFWTLYGAVASLMDEIAQHNFW